MKRRTLWIVGCTSVATLAVVLLAMNLGTSDMKIERKLDRRYSVADDQFARSMSVMLGPPIVDGNKIDVLVNGDEIFPAMLEAIRQAKRTLTFETFIYWSDSIGREFADAFIERARAGVKVHVLLDWIGSAKMEEEFLAEMRDAGVEIARYHKPEWSTLSRLNNRTHRKLLIVDGRVGFTGGVGIADQWRGRARNPDEWRDTHFRIEGPVVTQMQSVFMDNWIKARGRVLHDGNYFPEVEPQPGGMRAQMFSSSPTGGAESMHLMYLMAITAAEKSIHLSSSYFVPDDLAVQALTEAAMRGVDVQIIVPGEHTDSDIVRNASRARWGDLLSSGVRIYEYQPTMFHCKVLIVDGLLVSVGSTNFDQRSFSLNDEANLNVINAEFAHKQIDIFQQDLQRSRQITLEEWRGRPLTEKATEHVASMIGWQL